MGRFEQIIQDFIESGFNYQKLHAKYAAELEANSNTTHVADSLGHDAQQKLTSLHSMFKNGDLPSPPVAEPVKEAIPEPTLAEKLAEVKESEKALMGGSELEKEDGQQSNS